MARLSIYTMWVCDCVLQLKYAKYYSFCTAFCMCVVACHSALLLVVALPGPVTVLQQLTRAAGQWTHPRVTRLWPDARQNN